MKKINKLVLILAGLMACRTSPGSAQPKPQFKPDPALLITWEEFVKSGRNTEPPYIAKFNATGKTLWFIAAKHDNSIESDTFKLIKKVFTENKPQALIIEGVEKRPGLSAESYGFLVRDTELEKTKFWRYGDPADAVAFAIKNKIPCTSGEPPEAYIRAHLDKRFTLKDLFGFYVVRAIPEIKRQDPGKKTDFDEWFNTYAETIAGRADIPPLSLSEFKSWYEEKNGKKFDFDKMDDNEAAPISGKTALYTQKISCNISLIRNTAIPETIAGMLNRYDRVLIVYGSGHFAAEINVLENMLGKAEIIKNRGGSMNNPRKKTP